MTFVIESLFAFLFATALVRYVRERDPLSRDVMLVFSTVAVLFLLDVSRRLAGGALPGWLNTIAVAALLAQPFLTLRLISRIRHVARPIYLSALVGYVVAVGAFVVPLGLPAEVTRLVTIGTFVVTEAVAAGYFVVDARRRIGSARMRLLVAAFATATFAIAIMLLGARAGDVARLVALVSALGYAIAFVPPAWLRRIWQSTAAYEFTEGLLHSSGESDADAWRRFALAAHVITGADAVAVIVTDEEGRAVPSAFVAFPPQAFEGAPWSSEDFAGLLVDAAIGYARPIRETRRLARSLAQAVEGRLVSVVSFAGTGGRSGAVVTVSRYPNLFASDDRALVSTLGARAAIVAERSALAERLAATVDALRGASQAKSDFLASMSHELRTPLSAIIGFSDLMRHEERRGDQVEVPIEWVEHIHRSGEHLLGLINDVLDLSKVEAGRLELHREPFELAGAVNESLAGLRPLADRKRIRLSADVGQLRLDADRGRFRQVLYNLLSNAIKFTPENGNVRVDAERRNGVVRISVVDDGVGIAPEDHARVFEEFRQVGDRQAREAGTGLGLALTRRLVEAHGGTIELESTPNAGSRFTVSLAAAADAPEQQRSTTPLLERGVGRRDQAGAGAEILIIEDDPSAVELLRTYLESDGYVVRVAQDGLVGLEEARRRAPAAIVLDILLPTVDGWEVLRQLKADDELRDVPVVIVTILDERELGLALGAVDYFLKPVDRTALLARLARYTFTTKVRNGAVRVLAVDDDPAAVELIGAALRPEGFDVVTAHGGREAVERARSDTFDLVICDLVMPDLDGFGVVAELKATEETRNTPILILTAHTLSDEDRDRLNGNIVGLVAKGHDARAGLQAWLRRTVRRAGVAAPVGAE